MKHNGYHNNIRCLNMKERKNIAIHMDEKIIKGIIN